VFEGVGLDVPPDWIEAEEVPGDETLLALLVLAQPPKTIVAQQLDVVHKGVDIARDSMLSCFSVQNTQFVSLAKGQLVLPFGFVVECGEDLKAED
jgi:hypothetical protein